jgi:hypothetical protein
MKSKSRRRTRSRDLFPFELTNGMECPSESTYFISVFKCEGSSIAL